MPNCVRGTNELVLYYINFCLITTLFLLQHFGGTVVRSVLHADLSIHQPNDPTANRVLSCLFFESGP